MLWDLFAKVIDNHGDIGFAWRLAADLAARGEKVRLWIDEAAALTWMAPEGASGVAVAPWPEAALGWRSRPPEVVLETFGCGLPNDYASAMAQSRTPPVWIDVEHLSAEPYVERSHGLPSPRMMPNGTTLTQWYFYPGFTRATGGLVHEPDLIESRARLDRAAWIDAAVAPVAGPEAGERVLSLFCYENAALGPLLAECAAQPTLLLTAPGAAERQVERHLGPSMSRGALRATALPALTQPGYDRLLWASDVNLVRGEDSFVRAQWARKPFLWQIYPQADGVHARKLEAFLDLFLQGSPTPLQSSVRSAFRAWNGLGVWTGLPPIEAWSALCGAWCDRLESALDLTRELQAYARDRLLK